MRVLVSDKLSERGINVLKNADSIEVDVKVGLSQEELIGIIAQYDGLAIRSATQVTKEVINAANNLKVVGRAGIGVDNVDLRAASKKGIVVMNTPEGNTITTAEHTISMLLALSRKIPQATASLKKNLWEKKNFMGVEVYNKTLGIIGFGKIGQIVSKLARGLQMNVIVFDPYISKESTQQTGIDLVDMDELLKRSDYITLHVPNTKETKNLICEETINKMKTGVRIINCARGGIINESDLLKSINEKKVAGAALDVFEKEPPGESPLLLKDEVICTPHLGASTDEAQENVSIGITEQIVAYLIKGQIRNAINVPSVDAETLRKIQPYIYLSEKIGSLQSQLCDGGIQQINIMYSGDVAELETKPITISALKGLLSSFIEVNIVNAPIIAKERGIEVLESKSSESHDFASLISVEVTTDKESKLIQGTLFGKKEARIVRIDEYPIEAAPEGNMLVFSNIDAPGVIGKIGTVIGENNINIAGFNLSRTIVKGKAMAIVNLDSALTDKAEEEIKKIPNILFVKKIKL
jgi:D-3-phosphoglycerate dehydrogenase